MLHTELIRNNIYTNTLDKKIPLQFLSIIERVVLGDVVYIALFKPVKTIANKNYYNALPTITRTFHPEFGNQYIIPKQPH